MISTRIEKILTFPTRLHTFLLNSTTLSSIQLIPNLVRFILISIQATFSRNMSDTIHSISTVHLSSSIIKIHLRSHFLFTNPLSLRTTYNLLLLDGRRRLIAKRHFTTPLIPRPIAQFPLVANSAQRFLSLISPVTR